MKTLIKLLAFAALTATAALGQNQLVGNLTVTSNATFSSRTATRVPFFGTGGLLSDDADMTFATDTLTVTKATIGGISHIANAILGTTSNMTITAGTGNSRTLALQSTTSGGVATTFLSGDANQSVSMGAGSFLWDNVNSILFAGTGAVQNGSLLLGSTGQFQVRGVDTTDAKIRLSQVGSTNRNWLTGDRARGSYASPTPVGSGDIFLSIVGLGAENTTVGAHGPQIDLLATELWSTSQHGNRMDFKTTPNGSTGQTLGLTIAGNSVHVGTTVPALTPGVFNVYVAANQNLRVRQNTDLAIEALVDSGATLANLKIDAAILKINSLLSGGATQIRGTVSNTPVALTYAAPTSVDVTLGNVFTATTVNATGSVTFNATAAGTSGQRVTFIITNDATSAKTITFGTNFTSMGTLTPSGTGKIATVEFMSNGSTLVELCRSVLP